MHCSLNIWPNSSNPASFVPVVTDFYPFDFDKPVKTFQNERPEICTSCKHVIDSSFAPEGEKLKCPWCTKSFKPLNPTLAQEQTHSKRFIFRSPVQNELKKLLIFAIDSCCPAKEIGHIRSHVITAISALPKDRQFLLCVMHDTYNAYVDVYDNTVVYFDVPHTIPLTKHLNLNRKLTTSQSLPTLEPFIKSIICDPENSAGIDNLVKQLKGDNNLFARIILFSNRGPSQREEKNICIDWISPARPEIDLSHNIDGYFLDTSIYSFDKEPALEQIRNLIQKATDVDQIFNVKITADVTNYKCNQTEFTYAACVSHFSQTFTLSPQKIFGSILPSMFGVYVSYVHFEGNVAYNEIEWCSQKYTKSDNFIPVAAGIDPYQLMPYLLNNNELDSFISELYEAYHQSIDNLAGSTPDNSFAVFPNLQTFLRVKFWKRAEIFSNFKHNRVFLSYYSRSSMFYPNITLWADQNTCISKKCPLNKFFYLQMQSPPIVVFDEVQAISIYTDDPEISKDSKLYKEVEHEETDRFPKPIIIKYSMKDINSIFVDSMDLYDRVKENYE